MLTTPERRASIEQMLYALNARINGTLTANEIPKCVGDLQVDSLEGGRAVLRLTVDVDVGDRARLDASLQDLRQLESVLRAATVNVK